MHVVSKGSIDAVCFDALATLVRGDESIALELNDIDDLVAVVTALAEHVRATRGSHSNLDKAVAGGALSDFDAAVSVTVAVPAEAVEAAVSASEPDLAPPAPVAAKGKRGPKPKSVPVVVDRKADARVVLVASPVVVAEPAPVKPSPAVEADAVSEKVVDRRPAAEVITQAVVDYLEMRVRPQSFERILRAVRKADGVPDDVGKNLMDLLKRLTKKGTLLRTPTGGFSIAGA